MATSESFRELQWLLDSVRSETLSLQHISFHLSQLTSGCHQETTENSIKVNVARDDAPLFSELLAALAAACQATLRNVEFHHLEWEPRLVKMLSELLERNPSVRQIVLRRNRLSRECMTGLSEVVRRNCSIKELVISESEIGHFGTELFASALRANESLEELQIWDDSIGSKGSEELSKMIEANSTLKLLTIFDSDPNTATPLIAAILARNRATEVHIWSGEISGDKSSKIIEFVPANSTLRIYKLGLQGACRIACALALNSTVQSLDLTGVRLKSRWAREFRWVLEQNRTLVEAKLSETRLRNKGIVYLAAGLFKNRSLRSLSLAGNSFSGVGIEHLLCPLSRFSPLQNQANTTLKTLTLGGARTKFGREGLNAILQLCASNETLTQLAIHDDQSLRPGDFVKIFASLQKNASLKRLSLEGCKGVRGEAVLAAITETVQLNPWIEEIDLARTPLQSSGEDEGVRQRLGQNGKSEPEMETETEDLKDTPLTEPKSCRVFLCGQEYAGKTTLCNSISQNFSASKLPYIDQVRTIVNPVEQAVRTTGMKIKTLKEAGDTKISIWNLAGQHELFALHELMFPGHGSASLFVVVSSLFRKPSNREPKTPSEIEEDLQYWLRFVVSNLRRAVQQCSLPCVTIVLSHSDKIVQPSPDLQAAVNSIEKLREKFHGYVEFYPTVFTVDARSSASVSKLASHLLQMSKTILQRAPRIYQFCDDVTRVFSDWRSENSDRPVMKWKEFSDLCQIRVPGLRIRSRNNNGSLVRAESRRKAVATCLHQIGEVIYFEELGFLILDCEWFVSEVLSQLTKLGTRQRGSQNDGFVTRRELEDILKGSLQSKFPGFGSSNKVLENLDASDLLRMMVKLELCYERDPNDENTVLLIPSALEEGRGRPQRWELSGPECCYVGRHLECDDSSHMLLTPYFFPRLQVNLHNRITVLRTQHGATYSLEKPLITVIINGINIRVELAGQLGHYVDVLACSTKTVSETLKLVHSLVIPAVHSLTHGVTLSESIIRPECVRDLTPPRLRRTQSVPLSRLKTALLSVPAEAMYDYQHTWDAVVDPGTRHVMIKPGFDMARDLLSDDEIREVLHRRYYDLYNLAVELQVQPDERLGSSETDDGNVPVDPSLGGIARGLEIVLQRLKIIEEEIKDVKKEIQGLRYYEHKLLTELHRKVNYLATFTVESEERKVPNMLYFVRTENYTRRLVTSLLAGARALRLHMLCEFRGEMHVVEGQLGCEVVHVDNATVKNLAPYVSGFMTLVTFALKIGAHLAVGMAEMIPDLGREVARLADSSQACMAAVGIVGAAAAMGRRDVRQEVPAVQQWVVDFLRERRCATGKEIGDKFGLWRVRYRDSGHIAWICRRHLSVRAHEVVELPL